MLRKLQEDWKIKKDVSRLQTSRLLFDKGGSAGKVPTDNATSALKFGDSKSVMDKGDMMMPNGVPGYHSEPQSQSLQRGFYRITRVRRSYSMSNM